MQRRSSITVNGVTYGSIDEVPEPQRSVLLDLLADRDGDGVPDIVQGGDTTVVHHVETNQQIIADGTAYDSIDDVPEPMRSQVREQLTRASATVPAAAPSARPTPPEPERRPIVSRAGWSRRAKLFVAVVVIDLVVIGVAVALLLR